MWFLVWGTMFMLCIYLCDLLDACSIRTKWARTSRIQIYDNCLLAIFIAGYKMDVSYAISLYPSNNQESTAWLLIYDTNDRHNANWQIRRMVANENATTSFIEYRHLSV